MKQTQTPVSIVTGFLGSGKTTLINQLLHDPTMSNTAVLVNEFGAVAIDNDLLSNSDETVVFLGNGCICCSIKDDLATTLHDLSEQRRCQKLPKFDKILIETTGMANAGPIIDVILNDPLVQHDFALDRVITTVDTINGNHSLDLHAESVEQAAVADLIILTKSDLLPFEKEQEILPGLQTRLKGLNPAATICNKQYETVDAETIFAPVNHDTLVKYTDPEKWQREEPSKNHDHDHHHGRHDSHIRSFCVVRDTPITLSMFDRFQNELSEMAGPNLLRVKGFVNVAEKSETPALIQGAQQIVHEIKWLDSWPSRDCRTRIVFIGWDLDQQTIETIFDENNEKPFVSPL